MHNLLLAGRKLTSCTYQPCGRLSWGSRSAHGRSCDPDAAALHAKRCPGNSHSCTHELHGGQVDADLRKMLIQPDAPPPKVVAVGVWPQAIPQFNLGHTALVQVPAHSTACVVLTSMLHCILISRMNHHGSCLACFATQR